MKEFFTLEENAEGEELTLEETLLSRFGVCGACTACAPMDSHPKPKIKATKKGYRIDSPCYTDPIYIRKITEEEENEYSCQVTF